VQIIGRDKVKAAYENHSGWRASLARWISIVEAAQWTNFTEVRQSYANASSVGKYVVLNIANNEARLESIVNYADRRVIVTEIMTHKEYDRKDHRK
jgi:mRNA interferase HigB